MAIAKELLVRFRGDTKGLNQAVISAQRGLDRFNQGVNKVERQFTRLQNKLPPALQGIASGFAAIQTINLADTFTELNQRIENVTESAEQANQVFDRLVGIAQRDGSAVDALADAYVKLNVSTTESLKSQFDLVEVTDLLSRGFAAAGTNAQTAAGATLQLTQGLATNFQAAGQELNSIIEGAPLLAQTIAKKLGGEAAVDLKRFAEEGRLTAESFLAALLASEEAIKSYEIPQTVGRSYQRLKNEILLFIGATDDASNSTNILSGILNFATRRLEEMRLTVKLISPAFELVFNQIKQVINDALVSFRDFVQGVQIGIENLSQGVIKFNKLTLSDVFDKDYSTRIENARERINEVTAEMAGLGKQSTETASITNADLQSILENTKAVGEESKEAAKKRKEAEKEAQEALRNTIRSIKDVQEFERERANETTDILFELGRGYTDLRDVAVKALDDIVRSMLRMNAGGSAVSGIFGDIASSLFGSLFNPGASSITTASNGASVPVPRFKPINNNTGGSFRVRGNSGIDRNTLSLNGQPISNVSKGESVSVGRSGMGEGVTVNQTINIGAGVQGTVQAEIRRFLPQFKQLSVEAVQTAQNRGKLST